MSAKHRIDGKPFICQNNRYQTNTAKGEPHGPGHERGSVFPEPLAGGDGKDTLWLEHVTDKDGDERLFWLMWYNPNGNPAIPASGVLNEGDLRRMSQRLAEFIQVP
jgi:hypothetical protein